MQTIIALLFCLLLGVMLKVQGFSALLWLPFGFLISLYVTAQIALPLMLGMPRAIRLVAKRQMRAGVFFRLLVVPAIWAGVVFGGLFLLGYFWPSVATFIEANNALNVGSWLGIIAITLSPLSRKSRSDFREDFNRSYSRFYIARPPPHTMNCTIVKQLPNHCVPACLESVAKDLLLRVAVDHERDGFGKLEIRPAVQGGELLAIQLERHRHHLAFFSGNSSPA